MKSPLLSSESPLITVALPVYNEEKHIAETLESIIRQDYSEIEILISDNCSTDKTGIICREYAGKDHRIDYHCHSQNIGAAANHIYIMEKARGKYFMFAAGHDKWSKNLLSQCVSLLEGIAEANVAFGTPTWIGDDGKPFSRFSGWYDTRGLNPVARFFMVFWGRENPILGVIKRKHLPNLTNYNFAGADIVVLGELALKGEFLHAAESTFYRRQPRAAEKFSEKLRRYKSKEMRIEGAFIFKHFPLARLPLELLRIVAQAKISFLEKMLIIILLIPSLPVRYIMGKKDSNVK